MLRLSLVSPAKRQTWVCKGVSMDTGRSTFGKLIQADRASRESKAWSGTLLDYLEKIKQEPPIARLSHSRFYEMVTAPGQSPISESDDSRTKRLYKDEPLKVYNF